MRPHRGQEAAAAVVDEEDELDEPELDESELLDDELDESLELDVVEPLFDDEFVRLSVR